MRDFEEYCWRDLVSDEVRYIYSPYVRERSVGPSPALLVVHPGQGIDGAWRNFAEELLAKARQRKMEVIHSVVWGNSFLKIEEGEAVCARPCESAFFSTDLERILTTRGAGSLIVCGGPTSGALRATAVEGKSFGYKVAIAEETVGDESAFLHKIALFDIAHKYADVMSLEELREKL